MFKTDRYDISTAQIEIQIVSKKITNRLQLVTKLKKIAIKMKSIEQHMKTII